MILTAGPRSRDFLTFPVREKCRKTSISRSLIEGFGVRSIDRSREQEYPNVLLQNSCTVIFGPLKRYIHRNVLSSRFFDIEKQ